MFHIAINHHLTAEYFRSETSFVLEKLAKRHIACASTSSTSTSTCVDIYRCFWTKILCFHWLVLQRTLPCQVLELLVVPQYPMWWWWKHHQPILNWLSLEKLIYGMWWCTWEVECRWQMIKICYKWNIYSRNLASTSSSMNLRTKIIYNILMLPILIKSCFKSLSITGCYNTIG